MMYIFIVILCGRILTAQALDTISTTPLLSDSIFSPTSFWYTKIPFDAPLHPKSKEFVNEFLRQKNYFYKRVSINLTSYSSPVFIVGKNAPVVRVSQWACFKNIPTHDVGLAVQWVAVPIPPHAEPADGTDAEMTVYQPSTGTIWEFWKTRNVDGQWQACWGGRLVGASKTDGRWPGAYGTTATGLPFLGGQITAEELQRGEIRHAIGIALPELESGKIYSWPAKRSDGFNPKNEPNRIPGGLRFRLDPSIDVNTLKMQPMAKIIAKAAQIYGFVVWDHAGAITLRAQNTKSYMLNGGSNPYPRLFGHTPAWAVLDGFPWNKLQFLPMDYGKPL